MENKTVHKLNILEWKRSAMGRIQIILNLNSIILDSNPDSNHFDIKEFGFVFK